MAGGETRDEVGGDRRGVAERLVEGDGQLAEQRRPVGPQHELVVVGAVALRDETRPVALVEALLLEADRERADALAALRRGQRGERGGVDAAREQHPDGHVGDEVRANGVGEAGAQLDGQLGLALGAQGAHQCRRRAREAL